VCVYDAAVVIVLILMHGLL